MQGTRIVACDTAVRITPAVMIAPYEHIVTGESPVVARGTRRDMEILRASVIGAIIRPAGGIAGTFGEPS